MCLRDRLERTAIAQQVGTGEFVVEGGAADGAVDHDGQRRGDAVRQAVVVGFPGLRGVVEAQVRDLSLIHILGKPLFDEALAAYEVYQRDAIAPMVAAIRAGKAQDASRLNLEKVTPLGIAFTQAIQKYVDLSLIHI